MGCFLMLLWSFFSFCAHFRFLWLLLFFVSWLIFWFDGLAVFPVFGVFSFVFVFYGVLGFCVLCLGVIIAQWIFLDFLILLFLCFIFVNVFTVLLWVIFCLLGIVISFGFRDLFLCAVWYAGCLDMFVGPVCFLGVVDCVSCLFCVFIFRLGVLLLC